MTSCDLENRFPRYDTVQLPTGRNFIDGINNTNKRPGIKATRWATIYLPFDFYLLVVGKMLILFARCSERKYFPRVLVTVVPRTVVSHLRNLY